MRPVSGPKIAKNGYFWIKSKMRIFGSETGRTVPFLGQNESVQNGSFWGIFGFIFGKWPKMSQNWRVEDG